MTILIGWNTINWDNYESKLTIFVTSIYGCFPLFRKYAWKRGTDILLSYEDAVLDLCENKKAKNNKNVK